MSYCSPAHQKEDWTAHKRDCIRLAQEVKDAEEHQSLLSQGAVCAVCSNPTIYKCPGCEVVFYCTPAHQKDDWPAHKVQCPLLAQEALSKFHPCDEALLRRITACLARNGHHKEVGVMVQLNKAFSTDEQIWDAYEAVPGPEGRTPLMYSCLLGNLKRVQWLLKRGTQVNASTTCKTRNPPVLAGSKGILGVVREWIKRNAVSYLPFFIQNWLGYTAPPQTNTCGFTAMMLASRNGHPSVVLELCERGAYTNISLMLASGHGHRKVVRMLCKRGYEVNAVVADNNFTSLMHASLYGQLEVVRELCKWGADVNAAQKNDGFTALMWASKGGHLEVVHMLCDWGADVNAAQKHDGFTALMWASKGGYLEVAYLLIQKGANKAATTTDCWKGTALSVASGPDKATLQDLLNPGKKMILKRDFFVPPLV